MIRAAFVVGAFLILATPALGQDTHLLVITGVSGDEEHARLFHEWAATLIDAAKRTNGVARYRLIRLRNQPKSTGPCGLGYGVAAQLQAQFLCKCFRLIGDISDSAVVTPERVPI